jgi:hypothetical protein
MTVRIEHDRLGDRRVDSARYYGVHTVHGKRGPPQGLHRQRPDRALAGDFSMPSSPSLCPTRSHPLRGSTPSSLLSHGATASSRAYAAESLRLTTSALTRAVADGSDVEARSQMMIGAHLAGHALTLSGLGLVHGGVRFR